MTKRKCKTYDAKFKAKVAIEIELRFFCKQA